MGNIFTYQDPNSQPKDTATTRGSRRRQTTDTQGKVEGNQRELMEGYAHLQVVYVAPANGEREAHGVGFACWHARNALAKWPLRGRGACEGRIVARGRARDTRSRVDSDMRVRNEGQLVPCAIDFGATNRPERPLLGGMTRWREVRTMHSTSGRYNERGTRRSGSSPKVS